MKPLGTIQKKQELVDDDQKHRQVLSPEELGEKSASGSISYPESDDDVGKNANEMDLYLKDKNMDAPEELDIAKQVALAEEEQK